MRVFIKFFAIVLLLPGIACADWVPDSVTVMADSSLNVALSQLARDYSRAERVVVNTSFVSSGVQAAQITDGAAADILITPKADWIEQLRTQGLIDVHSRSVLGSNQLVLIGPEDSKLPAGGDAFSLSALTAELEKNQKLLISSPDDATQGIYVRDALKKLDPANKLEPYIDSGRNRNQDLSAIAAHNAYGIFFRSYAIGFGGIRVIQALPQSSYQPVSYYAVVIAGDNMNPARKFLEYLKSDDAAKIFQANGF